MNRFFALIFSMMLCLPLAGFAQVSPGSPAPSFELTDASGKVHKLDDYKGKWVVLEWFNKECPYVKKHYGSGNMQKLQKTYTSKNVAWFTINSSAQGKQGYQEPADALSHAQSVGSAATAFLIDSNGIVGRSYGAKTTPHMFVINPEGTLAYAGAIDDNDSSSPDVIPTSRNFVADALEAGMAGGKIDPTSSKPYGCSVKY